MTLVGLDLGEAYIGAVGVQRRAPHRGFRTWEEPMEVKEKMQKRVSTLEGIGEYAAMIGGEVEIIHRPGNIKI